ncbi:MAG: CHAT domain-containing protein [Elainellaceae cyanobacterium]
MRYFSLSRASSLIVLLTTLPISYWCVNVINESRISAQISSGEHSRADAEHLLLQGYQEYNQNEFYAALEIWQMALAIYQQIGDRDREATTLSCIGIAHDRLSNTQEAMFAIEQAQSIEDGETDCKASVVTSNGGNASFHVVYSFTWESGIEAATFGDSGACINRNQYYSSFRISFAEGSASYYSNLIQSLQQTLNIARQQGNHYGEINTLTEIGNIYFNLENYQEASDYYRQSLAIAQRISSLDHTTFLLGQLGTISSLRGEYTRALDLHQQQLEQAQALGSRYDQTLALENFGNVYSARQDYQQAMMAYQQALFMQNETGDCEADGRILSKIGFVLDAQDQSELAILFFKQSVNIREEIRQEIQTASPRLRQHYLQSVSDTYRRLAELLLQQNRVLEAQRVLDLLKVQELDDYLHDVRGDEDTEDGVEYWQPEQRILDLYQELLLTGEELNYLRNQPYDDLTSGEQARLSELVAKEGELLDSFEQFIEFPDVAAALNQLRQSSQGQNIEMANLTELQNNLANLGNAVLLYPLILDDRLELVLVAPNSPPIRRPVEVSSTDLNRAIVAFRDALRSPRSDAEAPAQQLYEWLIQPLEADLAAAGAELIVYAPDGALRYVPLAALHNGDDWLAQRFGITHITAASLTDFDTQPQGDLSVLAAACADCSFEFEVGDRRFSFPDLPFTQVEVEALANKISDTDTLINQSFSPDATVPRLGSYSVIHLATHAAFVQGEPDESFIVFGNGDRVTLRDIRRWNLGNADLVVLSACETGLGEQDLGNGTEILGFGYQMQRTGAKAAIASLWQVSDGGTQALMNAFYTALGNGYSKAEALQRAQIALIQDDASVLEPSERGIQIESTETGEPLESVSSSNLQGNLNHPYYWAPFILIGNGL